MNNFTTKCVTNLKNNLHRDKSEKPLVILLQMGGVVLLGVAVFVALCSALVVNGH